MSFCSERALFRSPPGRPERCADADCGRCAGRAANRQRSSQSVSQVRLQRILLAPNFSYDMHLVIGLWVVWPVPVSRLSARADALSTGLWISRAFRLVAFASGTVPCPLAPARS